jgi:hypothetical protein
MLNKVTSALEGREDFPGVVDAIEAIYKDTISSTEAEAPAPFNIVISPTIGRQQ